MHACASRVNNVRCRTRLKYLSLRFPSIGNAWGPDALKKLPLPSSFSRWVASLHVRPRGTRILQSISSIGGVLALLLILLATWIHTRSQEAGFANARDCVECCCCSLARVGTTRETNVHETSYVFTLHFFAHL